MRKTTRLYDKKGVMICEGDTIKYKDILFRVEFCNGAFKCMEKTSMFNLTHGDFWLHEIFDSCNCNKKCPKCPELEVMKK